MSKASHNTGTTQKLFQKKVPQRLLLVTVKAPAESLCLRCYSADTDSLTAAAHGWLALTISCYCYTEQCYLHLITRCVATRPPGCQVCVTKPARWRTETSPKPNQWPRKPALAGGEHVNIVFLWVCKVSACVHADLQSVGRV